MKKIIVAPDSFKGSMSSIEFIDTVKEVLNDCEITSIPIADGGEGTIDAIKSIKKDYKEVEIDTFNQFLSPIKASYIITCDNLAIIECAKTVGLYLSNKLDTYNATTYGLGLMIKDAVNRGIKDITVTLGGSSTTDAGAGMLNGLGYKFLDEQNNEFIPTGGSLNKIKKIIPTNDYLDINFTILVDVINPLCGLNGSAYIFGPQKGATVEQVKILDNNIKYFASISKDLLNRDESETKGAGAAGGLAYALMEYLDAKRIKGIDYLLDLSNFNNLSKDADLIITGEGAIDNQSLMGKVLNGIIDKANNTKIITIVGLNKVTKEMNEYLKNKNVTIYSFDKLDNKENTMKYPTKYLRMILNEIKSYL